MKFLGIDYGAKRIGLSLSDVSGSFAFPRETMMNDAKAIVRISEIVSKEGVGTIVVGDSRALSGEANPITAEADAFCDGLAKITGCSVERVWEAWSSVEARRFAPKGSEHDDAAAAAIILQRFLDARADSRA